VLSARWAAAAVMLFGEQFHPVAAVGIPITPLVALPPVPTLTTNAAVPFGVVTDGVRKMLQPLESAGSK
jgi:hypothetical protein